MRSIVTFSVLALVGCSAAPEGPHDDDAGFPIVVAEHDAGADAADAKADAKLDASAPKPTPSCPNVPEDVSNFKPSAMKPPRPFKAACGTGQVTAFYNACVGSSATPYSCSSWESANASNNACAACIISDDYDSAWGPVVNHSDYSFVNQAGCAQLLSAPSCASAEWSDQACLMAACDNICHGDGLYLLTKCEANATSGGCKAYDDAETAACVTTVGMFNKCFATDPETAFINVAATFCGGS